MTADLSALIARLEAAEVGSRELDAEIALATAQDGAVSIVDPEVAGIFSPRPGWLLDANGSSISASPFTTSLDAALALAERVLGGWAWQVDRWGAMSRITLNECDNDGWHRSTHRRIEVAIERPPALALCIAILRAKQGEGE